jgi:hypothetical protein
MSALFPPEYPDRPDAPLLSFGPSFSEEIARSIISAIWHDEHQEPHEGQIRASAALTMLEAFHPRDQLECMLAAQGVAAHSAAMECLRRAMLPDTPEAIAIKLRANAVQLNRMFSNLVRDMERLQSKPLTPRPNQPPSVSGDPSDDPLPGGSAPPTPANHAPVTVPHPKRTRAKTGPEAPAGPRQPARMPDLDDVPEIPEDIETRPDGTPGNLALYLTKPPVVEYVPREPALMMALRTRPSPFRMVNIPKDAAGPPIAPEPSIAPPEPPCQEQRMGRGPLDLMERMFTGDALSRFASARLDPDAPVQPMTFEDDSSVFELELISTGGDPAAEAERAEMIAAHPEGKPIVTFRHGTKPGPRKPPDDG